MATEFLRLYRELSKQEIGATVADLSFTKERKHLLHSMGHNVGGPAERVKMPKHHGKTARLRVADARAKALHSNNAEEMRKKVHLRETIRQTEESFEINREIQALVLQNKEIPKKLWKKMFGPSDMKGAAGSSGSDAFNDKKVKETKRSTTIPRPTAESEDVYGEVGVRCGAGASELRTSKNHWTVDEMDRLNKIYWELELPPSLKKIKKSKTAAGLSRSKAGTGGGAGTDTGFGIASGNDEMRRSSSGMQLKPLNRSSGRGGRAAADPQQAAWDNYYQTFAKRHQLFYPQRKEVEIITKVQECVATRRFKERGEQEFWQEQQEQMLRANGRTSSLTSAHAAAAAIRAEPVDVSKLKPLHHV